MKKFKKFISMLLLIAVAFVSNNNIVSAQTNNPKSEFVIEANETAILIGLLVPAVQTVHTAAARSFADVLIDAQTLAANVERAGSNMSDAQYQLFQRQLQELGIRLERIYNQPSSTPGPAGCMLECDGAYPGWGGGNGWNRFWCKSACLKLKIGVKGGSVGD